jgi:manganese/iron transport system ATP-binding protein
VTQASVLDPAFSAGSDSRNWPEQPARLDVEGVSVAYDGQPVLCDITFQVPHGLRVAVVGPNGAGKSTLFKALVGLLPLRAGKVLIHGLPLGHHIDCVAYVPQREEVDWRFPLTVADVVMMGRYGRLATRRQPEEQDREAVRQGLQKMGIANLAQRSIGELSGGQQQRVFLARALAQEPHILLMDEPFTGVDITTREAVLTVLDQLREQQVTTMISTHDLSLAASHFDRVLLLNRRQVAYGAPQEVFTTESLQAAFGGQLLMLGGGVVAVDRCCPPEPPEGLPPDALRQPRQTLPRPQGGVPEREARQRRGER